MSFEQGTRTQGPENGNREGRHRRSDRNKRESRRSAAPRRGAGNVLSGVGNGCAALWEKLRRGAKALFGAASRSSADRSAALRRARRRAKGVLSGFRNGCADLLGKARRGTKSLLSRAGGKEERAAALRRARRRARGFFGGVKNSCSVLWGALRRWFKNVFGGMSVRGRLLIAALGALFIWGAVSLTVNWIIPNAREKRAIESARSLVGATLEPAAATEIPRPTQVPIPAATEEVALTPAPSAAAATAMPAYAPNTTARISANGLVYSPELLEEYVALYAVNRDMGGWIRVRAIKNIDFPFVRGRNEYYITHDFYGGVNANGTAFLDETCKDWPRDQNLLIYAHNLKSGEMFGELNRLSNLQTLRANPFADCDTLYEKGVYIPVAIMVCSVDAREPDYFDFHTSKFRDREAFEKYITRCRELNLVNIQVDVNYSDELLSLVTCYDEAGVRRFVALYRRLRADETEASVLEKYFR